MTVSFPPNMHFPRFVLLLLGVSLAFSNVHSQLQVGNRFPFGILLTNENTTEACSPELEGFLLYDKSSNSVMVCTGAGWKIFATSGSSGGSSGVQSLQNSVLCFDSGTYVPDPNGNPALDNCTCYRNIALGFYDGLRCQQCLEGWERNTETQQCTEDRMLPEISFTDGEGSEVVVESGSTYDLDPSVRVAATDNFTPVQEIAISLADGGFSNNVSGTYVVTYTATDLHGNSANISRSIRVTNRPVFLTESSELPVIFDIDYGYSFQLRASDVEVDAGGFGEDLEYSSVSTVPGLSFGSDGLLWGVVSTGNVRNVTFSVSVSDGYLSVEKEFWFSTVHAIYAVEITPSTNPLTDFQVRIPIPHKAGELQANFDDLQIQTADFTPVPFWIEYIESNTAIVWAKVPSIPTDDPFFHQRIYVLGNNLVSGLSNGTATMEFFDDFSTDTGVFQPSRGPDGMSFISESGNGLLRVHSPAGSFGASGYTFDRRTVFLHGRQRCNFGDDLHFAFIGNWSDFSNGGGVGSYAVMDYRSPERPDNGYRLQGFQNSTESIAGEVPVNLNQLGTFQRFAIAAQDDLFRWWFGTSDTSATPLVALPNPTPYDGGTTFNFGGGTSGSEVDIDYYFTRKYANPEPVVFTLMEH